MNKQCNQGDQSGLRMKQALVLTSALSLAFASTHLSANPLPNAPLVPTAQERLELPIAGPAPETFTALDVRTTVPPQRFEVRAPQGAPNIVIVMLDDFGYGQASAFGGAIRMPVLERISNSGLRYNAFHTTAICSASRAALLTGRNHHVAEVAAVMETATAYPGNRGARPANITPLAEILRLNGYATAAFGKWHLVAPWQNTSAGPFDGWPTGSGFEHYYGFLGGDADQYNPGVYEGTTRINAKRPPGYHFGVDMTDRALSWMGAQHSLTPNKPFFLYYAPGATHAPHQAPKEWADRYKGQFAMGWDELRRQTFERQKKLGIIPQDAKLSPRPAEIPAWDSLDADEKRVFERQMEVYAGFAEHADAQIGRLVDQLEASGQLDNTIFIYIAGDNGPSGEGGVSGTLNEIAALNGVRPTAKEMLPRIDEMGGPETHQVYGVGWSWAGSTPFQWLKHVAGHFGGTRNGMAVMWPRGIAAKGEIRPQFHHIIDIAPTVLDAAQIPQPEKVNGLTQRAMDGVSMRYSFTDPKAPSLRQTQYFEIAGNRGLYHDGWMASVRHSLPWIATAPPAFKDDVWELYDLRKDFSQSTNVADKYPGKLKEMQALFDQEAVKNQVYPLDDRRNERLISAIAGRPDILDGRKSLTLYPGMWGIQEFAFVDVKGKPHTITADVTLIDANTSGVIVSQAGHLGGWTLYMDKGKLVHEYNLYGEKHFATATSAAIAPGKHEIKYQFVPDSNKIRTGGRSLLFVDGVQVAEGRIEETQPFIFSPEEGVDVGFDSQTAVSKSYKDGDNAFTGQIAKVTVQAD